MTSPLSHNIFTPIECIELPDATLAYHPDCFSLTQSNTFLTQLLDSNIIHWQQKNIKIWLYMDSKVFLTRVESKEESRALPRFLTL
jgi:hypothetical protein